MSQEHYETRQWSGYPLYQCVYCPWNSIGDEGAMRDHLFSAHALGPDPAQRLDFKEMAAVPAPSEATPKQEAP